MPLKTKPFGNNVIVEVLGRRNATSVDMSQTKSSLTDSGENYGILRDFNVDRYHLTASSAIEFSELYMSDKAKELEGQIGKVVRWEDLADSGQRFVEDGKTYSIIPWWRLIGFENTVKEKKNGR